MEIYKYTVEANPNAVGKFIRKTWRKLPDDSFEETGEVANVPAADVASVRTDEWELEAAPKTLPNIEFLKDKLLSTNYRLVTTEEKALINKQPIYDTINGTVTTTGQALVDITGLSVALEASSVYDIEVHLFVGTSNVSTGTRYAVNYSGNATIDAGLRGSSTSTADKSERVTALNTQTGIYLTSSNQTGFVSLRGRLVTTTAGDFTVKHLKVTSGTSSVFAGSFIKAFKVN